MDLAIYDETQSGVSEAQLKLVEAVLTYAGDYLSLTPDVEMSVTFVNNDRIQEINKKYRDVDKATDVISFAIEDVADGDDHPIVLSSELAAEIPENIGDIFVSVDKVQEQADYLGHSYERELGFLVVHGFLHLNGYDHLQPEDEKVMFKLQRDILDSYGLTR